MRRERARHRPPPRTFDTRRLTELFDRHGVVAVWLFGSAVSGEPHALSDLDMAFLGTDGQAEDRLFDELYEALQRELGEGSFDLVPLRRAPLHLQFSVATEGRLLLSRDAALTESFHARAIVRWFDFKRHRDEYFAAGA